MTNPNPNNTIKFYNKNADSYASNTTNIDFRQLQECFLNLLPSNGYILDFGCGSGRDTKYFLNRDFCVDAVDGSKELCDIASEYTGINVRQMLFQELDELGKYDGIWACASILHLKRHELIDVMLRMQKALKSKGVIYASFKYGKFEGVRGERYFTDFTKETFLEFVADVQGLKIEKYWVTNDARPDKGDEQWLNLILRKVDMH